MTKLNAEELLKIAQGPRERGLESNGLRKESNKFISTFKIEPGPVKITCDVIYWVYVKWCKARVKHRIKRRRFFDGWSKLYTPFEEYKKSKHIRGYLLTNIPEFNLDTEEKELVQWFNLEDERRARMASQRKKKKQKAKVEKKLKELETLLKVLQSDS